MISILKALWLYWKDIAQVIGHFQSRVLLSLFYFLLFGPVSLALKILADPLLIRPRAGTRWTDREVPNDVAAMARRQF